MEHPRCPPWLAALVMSQTLDAFSALCIHPHYQQIWGFFLEGFLDSALEGLVGRFRFWYGVLEGQDNWQMGLDITAVSFQAVLCNDWGQSICIFKGWMEEKCGSSLQFRKQNTTDALCRGNHEP